MKRNGFIIDLNKCTGCNACVLACAIENAETQSEVWREVRTYNELKHPGVPVFHYSLACNHCEKAPCKPACPAEAFSRDAYTGAMVHHEEKCLGCRYCTWACPYDAPKYSIEKGVVEKCTFCLDRIHDGGKPACCALCPTGALDFGPVDVVVFGSPGFSDFGIAPAVKIIPHRLPKGPEVHYLPEQVEWAAEGRTKPEKAISLAGEWPLAVFTFMVSLMAGMMAGYLPGASYLSPLWFLALGLAAAIVSAAHLGKKLRAWRSVVHFKDSWLSREIVFFSIFFATGTAYAFAGSPLILGYLAAFFGLATLFAIDRVYDVVRKGHPIKFHSADTLLTGLLFAAWFACLEPLLLALILIKVILFIFQEVRRGSLTEIMALARLFIGLALPVVFFFFTDLTESIPVLVFLVIGEGVDRARFYRFLSN